MMSTKVDYFHLCGLQVRVVRKAVKNLHLSVLPPLGDLRLTSPTDIQDDGIRLFLISKLGWIRKQQEKFVSQRRQTKRQYISGETYYFLGKPYRLRLEKSTVNTVVKLKGRETLLLRMGIDMSSEQKEQVITEWYRSELRKVLNELILKWEQKLSIKLKICRIQRMKTRWASCNTTAGRIVLNLDLAKKPVEQIEYILVQEWLSLAETKNSSIYSKLLNKHLPKWKFTKEELDRSLLSHEAWK